MALHGFVEYLKYSWKAKGRHGTHSPFVYEFVEQVLMDKGAIKRENRIEYNSLPLKYENLINRIAVYYGCNDVLLLPIQNKQSRPGDMLLLNDDALQWNSILEAHPPVINSRTIIVVPNIHGSLQHTKSWQQLTAHTMVRMSIDLYGMGLLLFNEEFKEKQHFVLKY
jgi:hypothetical protein